MPPDAYALLRESDHIPPTVSCLPGLHTGLHPRSALPARPGAGARPPPCAQLWVGHSARCGARPHIPWRSILVHQYVPGAAQSVSPSVRPTVPCTASFDEPQRASRTPSGRLKFSPAGVLNEMTGDNTPRPSRLRACERPHAGFQVAHPLRPPPVLLHVRAVHVRAAHLDAGVDGAAGEAARVRLVHAHTAAGVHHLPSRGRRRGARDRGRESESGFRVRGREV